MYCTLYRCLENPGKRPAVIAGLQSDLPGCPARQPGPITTCQCGKIFGPRLTQRPYSVVDPVQRLLGFSGLWSWESVSKQDGMGKSV